MSQSEKKDKDPEEMPTIDEILLNLKIVSQINKYDKLSTCNENLAIESRYFQSFRRYWSGDSRERTLDYIELVVNHAFQVIDNTFKKERDYNLHTTTTTELVPRTVECFQEDNSHLLQRFHVEMGNACRGLNNLKETYQTDVTTISRIDLIVQKMNLRMNQIQKLLKITVLDI